MILNVISDIRNGRRDQLEAHLRSRSIHYRIWDAVMLPGDTVASINASHKQIVRWAKSIDAQCVIIAEDDVFFPAEDGWNYWLSKEPGYYDIYFGGNYAQLYDGRDTAPYRYVLEPVGMHCYMMGAKYYDKFLAVPDTAHIDTAQVGNGIFKVCHPFAAIQRPGFSANSRQQVDYNTLLKPEDIYGGLPDWTKEV